MIWIAIDAMGGDRAPEEIVAGAVSAARDFGVGVILVGDEAAIRGCLPPEIRSGALPAYVRIHAATQLVPMDEAPRQALKKTDSSLAVATRLHAEGTAQAVLSAGNTGAASAFALFTLKRIPGIDRPGIATVFPTQRNPLVLIDAGANVDCRPHHLADFAMMGAAYVGNVHGIIPGEDSTLNHGHTPKVGLLSIGEEECKGNDLTRNAYKLIADNAGFGSYDFHGNVEGRDIGLGTVDVVVCDGFVGNVVLKVAEGLAKFIGGALRESLTADLRSKLGAILLAPSLKKLKKRMEYTDFGGAVLLGVNGVCIICHGSSEARSIYSAIRIARQTVEANVVDKIRGALEKKVAADGQSADGLQPDAAGGGATDGNGDGRDVSGHGPIFSEKIGKR